MGSLTTALPVLDADPFDLDVLEDPFPLQARLRDLGPVVRLPRYDVVALGRYAEVRPVLRDWQSFRSGAGVGVSDLDGSRPQKAMLEFDPPHHDTLRRVLSKILSPSALRRLRDRFAAEAERVVDEALGGAAGGRVVIDAVPLLAQAFPLSVFPDAVGIEAPGRENLLPFADFVFNSFGPPNQLLQAAARRMPESLAYVTAQTERERLSPGGFGAALWAAADRGEIHPYEAPNGVRALLSAGLDTTVHGIGALIHAFAVHPTAWERFRARPEMARVAFDEAVRWASPVQLFFRSVRVPVEVAGVPLRPGQRIALFLGAANRDPRRWADPGTFDLDRDPSGQVGFGFGLHQCVGQHLARMEAEVLVTELARRVRTIDMIGPGQRRLNNTLRAWASLPLRLTLA